MLWLVRGCKIRNKTLFISITVVCAQYAMRNCGLKCEVQLESRIYEMESVLQTMKRESGKLVALREACERTLSNGKHAFT
jgi:hypothetical protein